MFWFTGSLIFVVIMPFTFTYHDQNHPAVVEFFSHYSNDRYRIRLATQEEFVIAPAGFRDRNNRVIWLQTTGHGESHEQPSDLVQAIGEGLQKLVRK